MTPVDSRMPAYQHMSEARYQARLAGPELFPRLRLMVDAYLRPSPSGVIIHDLFSNPSKKKADDTAPNVAEQLLVGVTLGTPIAAVALCLDLGSLAVGFAPHAAAAAYHASMAGIRTLFGDS